MIMLFIDLVISMKDIFIIYDGIHISTTLPSSDKSAHRRVHAFNYVNALNTLLKFEYVFFSKQ